MENSTEPEVLCDNCGRKIPESKSFLHESYCRRNVVKCPKCKEPVDKAELEQHEQEAHKLAPCKYCKKEFEAKTLESHVHYCNQKPKLCQYCNCDVFANEYTGHVNTCGSRTKKCITCNKNILLRDFDTHEATCAIDQRNYENSFPVMKEEPKKVEPTRSKPAEVVSKPRPEPKIEKITEPIYKPKNEYKPELIPENNRRNEIIRPVETKGTSAVQMKPDYLPKDAYRIDKPIIKDTKPEIKPTEYEYKGGLNIKDNLRANDIPKVGISLDPTSATGKDKGYIKDIKPSHKPINQSVPVEFTNLPSQDINPRQKPLIFDSKGSINPVPTSNFNPATDFTRNTVGDRPERISSTYKVGELSAMNKQSKQEPKTYGVADSKKSSGPSSGTGGNKYDPRDKGVSSKENKSTNSSTRHSKPNANAEIDAIIAKQLAEYKITNQKSNLRGKYNDFEEDPHGFDEYDTQPVRGATKEEEIMQKAIEESLRAQKQQQPKPTPPSYRNQPSSSNRNQPSGPSLNQGFGDEIPPEILAESEDLELQRALKESLDSHKGKGGPSYYKPGDTMNSEEFKRAIALSKMHK